MGEAVDRVLLHLDSGERRVVDPAEVYYLEVLPVSRGLLGNLWKAFGSD